MTIDRRALLASGAVGALIGAAPAAADPGRPSARLGDILPTLLPQHPRLLVTDSAMATCRARAARDPVYRRMIERIVQEARTILSEPVVAYRLAGTERPSMLGGARQMIRRIVNSAFAWRWTGERAFADRVRTELLNAARFPEWNHTHFLDVAEIAFAVAIGYDWVHAALTPDERATIRMAIVEKALLWADRAYRGADDEWLKYPTYTWNWNQVCNGGVLAAALAVAEDEPQLAADVMAGVDRSLPLALAALGPDGAGPEGPVYWTYGITYHVLILAMLATGTASDHGLGATHAFDETDVYRLWVQGPTGAAFNYGDCKELLSPTSALAWLGERHGHAQVTALARREMLAQMERPRLDAEFDRFFAFYAIWYPEAGRAPPMTGHARHFRGNADLAIFRGDWDSPQSAYLGFKAGNNAANHSHLDCGSFVLEGQGVRWAIDLGSDSYQIPGYFDDKTATGKRFGIFRISTAAHATLMPLGVGQDPFGAAPITGFAAEGRGGHAIVDLTAVYAPAARRIRRGVDFADGGRRVTIRDEVTGAAAASRWRWAMPTRAAIRLDGARATLTQDGKTMQAVIETPGLRFVQLPATPADPRENPNTGVSILAIVAPADAAGACTIQVALYPLGDTPVAGADRPLDTWRSA